MVLHNQSQLPRKHGYIEHDNQEVGGVATGCAGFLFTYLHTIHSFHTRFTL